MYTVSLLIVFSTLLVQHRNMVTLNYISYYYLVQLTIPF